MKPLAIDGLYAWSNYDHAKRMDFNGHLWVRPEGNVIIDPPPMSDDDVAHLDELGGAALCIITNADHRRGTRALHDRLKFDIVCHDADARSLELPVARTIQGGETIVDGVTALHMPHGKTPGEIALYFSALETLLFGDILRGHPVGALRLLPDDKLANPPLAALAVRRLLPLRVKNVLVGDGCCLFGSGHEAIIAALADRNDIDVFRLNIDDIGWTPASSDARYRHDVKWISRAVGARLLAYNVRKLPPGALSGPMHYHHDQEELFLVLEGACTLERPNRTIELHEGDFVCCMADERGAHTLRNTSAKPCVVLCLSNQTETDKRELVGLVDFRSDLISP